MLITPDHFSPHRFGNSRVKWSLGLFDTKYGEERRIQMIPTKRCLVLSIRIQLQISTFLAIKVQLQSADDQCGYVVLKDHDETMLLERLVRCDYASL